MKKTNLLVAIVSVGMIFASCDSHNHDEHEDHDHDKHAEMESHEGHDHGAEESDGLRLNDGEKWLVNDEMMVHVRSMEKQVTTFSAAEKKDYAALAVDLKANISELTSSCTMTGESHDELHKWLLPHIKTVDELKGAENDVEAAEDFAAIQNSMKTFNQYFK